MKHLEVRQKYSAARRIFSTLFVSVSSGNETLRNMLDILLQGVLYNRLQVQINQPVYACPVGRRIYPFGTYMAVPPLGPTVQLEI